MKMSETSDILFADPVSSIMGLNPNPTAFFQGPLVMLENAYMQAMHSAKSNGEKEAINARFTEYSNMFAAVVEGYKGQVDGFTINEMWKQWHYDVFGNDDKFKEIKY